MIPPALPRLRENEPNHAHVVQCAVGHRHGLLLTDEGVVYSWGSDNSKGQLGRPKNASKDMDAPSPITDILRDEIIVQIASGANHCLALSQEGVLYAWGNNKSGQIGIGVNPVASSSTLHQKTPVIVPLFRKGGLPVHSCSCGPESSACVTTKGEVYVWGSISFYMFGGGTKYARDGKSEENCSVPVQIRGASIWKKKLGDYIPSSVSLHIDELACTLSLSNAIQDFMSMMASLKGRSSRLTAAVRAMKQAAERARPGYEDSKLDVDEIQILCRELNKQREEAKKMMNRLDQERDACNSELVQISRQLMVCDQQDTSLLEFSTQVDLRLDEATHEGAKEGRKVTLVNTQMGDVKYFRESNEKRRYKLLGQRDKLNKDLAEKDNEYSKWSRQKSEMDGRMRLIQALQRGDAGGDAFDSVDDGLALAMSKRDELVASDPQLLSGASGRFTGFREVLSISDRALADVSSALGEVATVAGSQAFVIVAAVEASLKLRKELNAIVHEKLGRAERGRKGNQLHEDLPGLHHFFMETKFMEGGAT